MIHPLVLSLLGFGLCDRLKYLYTGSDDHYWEKHKKTYGINILSQQFRFEIFRRNLALIRSHNSDSSKTYFLRLNKFAHLTDEEFKAAHKNCYLRSPKLATLHNKRKISFEKTPVKVDWREMGMVSPVKDQMKCGSCWAFSVTGAIESQYLIRYNKSISLSEQQLVDCTRSINYGCNGGFTENTFSYLKRNPIINESEYKYRGYDRKCVHKEGGITLKGALKIGQNDRAMMEALATLGPAAIAIDASHVSFRFYGGGVYYESNCSPVNLDHAVLAVGYNLNATSPYYIVKNSWASNWGQNGFINILLQNNHCGVASEAFIPQV